MNSLPSGLRVSGRGIQIRIQRKGRTYYHTIPGDLSEGHISDAASARQILSKAIDSGAVHPGSTATDDQDIDRYYAEMFRTARKRKRYGLSKQDEQALVEASGGRCAVTGISFGLHRPDGWLRRPFAPSIDRIDSKVGYDPENVRLVCVAVNIAMNEWGEEVFRLVAEQYLLNRAKGG